MKLIKTAKNSNKLILSKREWKEMGKRAGWIKMAQKVTKKDIDYSVAPYGHITTIPSGTQVSPSTNLPQGGYWVENWENMTDTEESWARNYGFHVSEEEVKDLENQENQENQELSTEELKEAYEDSEEDIKINDDGQAFYSGKLIAEPNENYAPDFEAIREWMDKNNYYPNVWERNDHGNVSLYYINEQGKPKYLGGLV